MTTVNIKSNPADSTKQKAAMATIAVCVSATLTLGGLAPCAAFAGQPTTAPEKSQVVYVKAASDGEQQGVYVVNEFDGVEGVAVEDAGRYASVVNLTDSQKLANADPSFTSESESFAYQGNLDAGTETPWTIETTYYLDGVRMDAKDIAGKSGHVRLEASIAPNEACDGPYAENYLVQATAALDEQTARNVTSDDGTVAQAAGDVQASFMVLPGKSAVCAMEADVENFEFDGWQIVGVPLSMAIDVDDSEFASATDSLKQLEDATQQLADGADEVKDGSAEVGDALDTLAGTNSSLNSGISSFGSAMSSLASGAKQLDAAVSISLATSMQQLAAGSAQYQAGLNEKAIALAAQAEAIDIDGAQANCESAMTGASTAFAQAYAQAFAQAYAPAFSQAYTEALASGADTQTAMQMASASAAQSAASSAAATAASSAEVATTQAQAAQATQNLAEIAAAKAANRAASQALEEAASSYNPLAQSIASATDENSSTGVAALASATSQLSSGLEQATSAYGSLSQGIGQYAQGVSTLASSYGTFHSGVNTLASGTGELASETNGINQKALDSVKEQLSDYLNPEFTQQDFVNGETNSIDTVQFIYKTGEIKAPEVEDETAEDEPEQTFFEKLAALFGM